MADKMAGEMTGVTEFVYRLPGNTISTRPGSHRSNSRGSGMNFVSHARLMDQPDPRRLDLRASIANIRKEWLVRVNQQRAAVAVTAIVDVSATMHFGTECSKISVAADFLEALGYSAGGLGDSVSLYAFDEQMRNDLTLPQRYGRGTGLNMAAKIRSCKPTGPGAANIDALAQCVDSVAGKTALIFIVSDFHFPINLLETFLDPLAGALVVPIVIWDRAEVEPPEGYGLLSVRQMGNNSSRHIWLTPEKRSQWQDNIEQRQTQIAQAFASRDERPFYITRGFNPEKLSRYFMETDI